MNPFLRKVLANTSWLASEKLLTMAANLLAILALARSLSPDGYGSLSYLLAIIALVSPLTSLGLNVVITRELVNQPDRSDSIMATAVIFRLAGSIIGTLGCLMLSLTGWALEGIVDRISLAILALANLFTAFHVFEYWFHAHVNARIVARMRGSLIVFFSGIKIACAIAGVDLIWVVTVFALEAVSLGLGFWVIYRVGHRRVVWESLDLEYGLGLLKQGFWLVLSGFAAVIYLKIDQVMLAQMVNREAVGIYAVAARLSEIWYFFATALTVSVFPALLKIKNSNPERYQLRLQQICDVLLGVACILAIGVSVLSDSLIALLFGDDYRSAASILVIHIWASVFVYMRALVSKWLIAENLLMFSLISHGLGAIINMGANLLLIPPFGGVGAAYATVLSYFVASYAAFWLSSKTRSMAHIMTRSLLLPVTLGYRLWRRSLT